MKRVLGASTLSPEGRDMKTKRTSLIIAVRRASVALAVTVGLLVVPSASFAAPAVHQDADVVRVDAGPVEGTATLVRTNNSISMTMKTTVSGQLFDLPIGTPLAADWEVGDATTSWFVVFNNPSGCTAPCGEDDVIAALFGDNPAEVGIHHAAGRVAGSSSYNSGGSLRVGDMSGVVGGGTLPFLALTNPMGAEVHIVNRSHGPASALTGGDLGYALNSLDGGCDINICGDAQAAIFAPPA